MMPMKRQQRWALLCALVLLVSVLLVPAVQADQSNTVYVRKHVSLLYDNSGSMSQEIQNADNLKWSYASYAAQVFTGLLNETDTLTVTFMNKLTTDQMKLDLSGDRQSQVQKVLDATGSARGGTPLSSAYTALDVLIREGLLSDAQLGAAEVDESEQFWLVLTTDGNFNDDYGYMYDPADVEDALAKILEDYSSLQLVYFGIGTEGDTSSEAAIDFRESAKLNAYPNFSAYFAEDQDQIVSTMQELSNRISGRYDVQENVKISGKTVTIRISGESSPIRNVAVLAQQTGARLVSATAEDGTKLEVSRSATIAYPYNRNYDNVPAGTLGGCTAMITSPTGKIPEGTVTLTFSEDVSSAALSLMYEPAIHVALTVQRKTADGKWEDVRPGQKLTTGDTLRLQYEIREDGADTPLAANRLPGKSEAEFTCGDRIIQPGEEFTVPAGNTTVTASVSLMDGAYRVSTSRTIQAVNATDFRVSVSGPLTVLDTDLAGNTSQYIDFTVTLEGTPVESDLLPSFRVDSGTLQGQVTYPGRGVIRFTPKQTGATAGEHTVKLYFGSDLLGSQTVSVITITYSATASGDLTLVNDRLADNTQSVTFRVTEHRGTETKPLAQTDSGKFRVEAKASDGTVLGGKTAFKDGVFTFTPNDPDTPVGDYTVKLYQDSTVLAQARVTVLPVTYNAQVSGDLQIIDVDLADNTQSITFTVTAQRDGKSEPITDAEATQFAVESKLPGTMSFHNGVFTFTPQGTADVGTYPVVLRYGDATLAQATVTVIPDPVTYTAEADRELTLFSNALAGNREAITFAVTAHRSSGDSPITREEAEKFRLEALSADGTVLNGTVDFRDGSFIFIPNDPLSPVGSYTVVLYQGDVKLAQSQVTVLLYNAQYTVEAHVSDPATVQRFGLLENQAHVAFVIYADGLPCSRDTLESMVQEMITVSQDPGSILMALDVTVGTWNGTPAILVRPTSSTDNFILEFLQRPFAALGLVPAGDLTVTLTVDAAKGDSASGKLEIVFTMAELIFYIALLVAFLVILVLILMVIYSNWRMPRIRPGHIHYYRVIHRDGQYYVSVRESLPIKNRFYLRLLPVAETVRFHDQVFTAGNPGIGFQFLNLTIPKCVLSGTRRELSKYSTSGATPVALQLLTYLRTAVAGGIQGHQIDRRLPGRSIVPHPYGPQAEERVTQTILMADGGYIVKRDNSLEFWTYTADE